MNKNMQDLSKDFELLRIPTITEKEYIEMRRSGMMHSELISYDLAPPAFSFPHARKASSKSKFTIDQRHYGGINRERLYQNQ